MTHTKEFSQAMVVLTLTDVFFTSLMYSIRIEQDTMCQTLATDGVKIIYNPEFFVEGLNAKERVFAIVHELLHIVLYHPLRRGAREPKRWNIACDHVVNLQCKQHGYKVPEWAHQDQKYVGLTAEQVYDLLDEEEEEGGGGDNPMSGDVLDYNPNDPGNAGKSVAEVQRGIGIATEQAAQAAKQAGQNTGWLTGVIGNAQVHKEPWHSHLRRFMTSMFARRYNWNRIDARRAVMYGVLCPQNRAEQMGHVVIMLDCSGSITQRQLDSMGSHISDILRDCQPSSVSLGYFDSKVRHTEEYTGPDYCMTLTKHGGGGTRFEPCFDWVDQSGVTPSVMIMLTDMCGSFPEYEPAYPVVWVTQTEGVISPFGEMIYADFNE